MTSFSPLGEKNTVSSVLQFSVCSLCAEKEGWRVWRRVSGTTIHPELGEGFQTPTPDILVGSKKPRDQSGPKLAQTASVLPRAATLPRHCWAPTLFCLWFSPHFLVWKEGGGRGWRIINHRKHPWDTVCPHVDRHVFILVSYFCLHWHYMHSLYFFF